MSDERERMTDEDIAVSKRVAGVLLSSESPEHREIGEGFLYFIEEIDKLRTDLAAANEKLRVAEERPYKHPMQSARPDDRGTLRFVANPIVQNLLDYASDRGRNLNDLAARSDEFGFEYNDWRQFAQLIGYSVSGFFELSYVSNTWEIKSLDDGYMQYAEETCYDKEPHQ